MNSIVQLFKYFGAFAAFVLCVGFLSNSDYALLESRDVETFKEMSLASGETDGTVESNETRRGAYKMPDRLVRNRPSSTSTANREISRPGASKSYDKPVASSRSSSKKSNFSAREIEDWIQVNAAQTFLESEKETMSPGVILATGVYFLQQGRGDTDMNAADVAAYLAEVRQSASTDAKAKMKYIANSEAWFEGLKMAGFDGDKIAAIFSSHELKAYDKHMYSRHVERKIEETSYALTDDALGADKEVRNRDLADAYNDYADRSEVRAKYSLPTLTKAKALSTKEVSAGRKAAESIKIGQTKKFDDPREFWSVLKEIIALEHNYDSWSSYEADHKRAATKEFQSRSDIMATGGIMQVTRKKGA